MTRGPEGDEPTAIEALYDAFAPPLYRYAWSLLGEGEQVAEAVHDGLVAGVFLEERRADPADRGPWLYALVRSACQRRGLAHVSPYTRLATVAAEEPVARMFARLPASHRELVELNLRHALPPSAVARVLGLDSQICGELSRSAIRRAAESLAEESLDDTSRHPDGEDAGGASEGAPPSPAGASTPEQEHVSSTLLPPGGRRAQIERVSSALSLLRPPGPPPGLRERVVRTCLDPELAAIRERLVARMHPLTGEGYPIHRARAAGAPREATRTPDTGPPPPPRVPPGDRVTTHDHPLREEMVAELAGTESVPDEDGRTSPRRWPLPAVSGLATVVLAVGLWSWASAVGGPSTVIGTGPDQAGHTTPNPAPEAVATASDSRQEAEATTDDAAAPPSEPTHEATTDPDPRQDVEQTPATGGAAPSPLPEDTAPPVAGDRPEEGSEGSGEDTPDDEGVPVDPPEEGGEGSGDGDRGSLLNGLLKMLFGDG
ncbi:sigma-70 family RNA polymerase sigma factor [Nocardiopsis sp. ATB16-24]|uniref:RNA polymerase sigma factor n=1 Tax=Nocardiopsis sp. ATB16-24 TaxID=3019555 RepID=UPI002555E4B1|nr:sigma-70 family RNA polymerase sigma factor [Nocardiopsis sp. ATB16-24]